MQRFNSPALYQPDLPLSAQAVRALLGAAAILFTLGLWFGVGTQASHPDDADTVTRVTLPPVVISARQGPADNGWMTLAAQSAGIDCDNQGWPTKSGNRVNLTQ